MRGSATLFPKNMYIFPFPTKPEILLEASQPLLSHPGDTSVYLIEQCLNVEQCLMSVLIAARF